PTTNRVSTSAHTMPGAASRSVSKTCGSSRSSTPTPGERLEPPTLKPLLTGKNRPDALFFRPIPTCVGVNREAQPADARAEPDPHVRGGESIHAHASGLSRFRSPRAWG